MIYNKEDCKHYSVKNRCCTKPGIPYTCKKTNCGNFKLKEESPTERQDIGNIIKIIRIGEQPVNINKS